MINNLVNKAIPDLVSKATINLPEIPSAEDVTGQIYNVIPSVPALPTTREVSGAVRRAGEKVLDSVDNNIIYGTTLTRGVEYCGDAAASIPFIGSSIRALVPDRQGLWQKGENDIGDSSRATYRRRRERPRRRSEGDSLKVASDAEGWNFLARNPLVSAKSLLSALLPNQDTFSRLTNAVTQVALQTSLSASELTFSYTDTLFKEYNTSYSRALSKGRAVRYCREKSPVEATQYFLKFALSNIKQLCVCSPGEIIRALAMFGALQKVLGNPYPPAEPAFDIDSEYGRVEFLSMKRLYDFALASYGPLILDILRMNLTSRSMEELIIRMTGVLKKDILRSNANSKFQKPAFAVVMDYNYKAIVVTIRGTANVEDVLTDVHAESAPFHVGHTHRGILCSAQYLDRELRDFVKNTSKSHEDWEIVVTGHSLGGAVATVLAIIWHNDASIGSKVRAISFAAAACLSKPLAEDCIGFVTSVVYADDLVSRLSLGSVENLRHILVGMCSQKAKEQAIDTNSISTLIEAYITAKRNIAPRLKAHLHRAYIALTAMADSQPSDHQLMYPGGKLRFVIPEEDYVLYPNRRPASNESNLIPPKMHMLSARNLKSLGKIVCSPSIFLRHFPTILNDFFRPIDLAYIADECKSEISQFELMDLPLSNNNLEVGMDSNVSDSEADEKMDTRSRNRSLTQRRHSFHSVFHIRDHSIENLCSSLKEPDISIERI